MLSIKYLDINIDTSLIAFVDTSLPADTQRRRRVAALSPLDISESTKNTKSRTQKAQKHTT